MQRHPAMIGDPTTPESGSHYIDEGACTAGNFVWRSAGSMHSAHSPNGCLAIGIFQKANEFLDEQSG